MLLSSHLVDSIDQQIVDTKALGLRARAQVAELRQTMVEHMLQNRGLAPSAEAVRRMHRVINHYDQAAELLIGIRG